MLARSVLVTAVGITLGAAPSARAESENFEWSGKIYTKWLYRNNDKAGVVSLGISSGDAGWGGF